MTKEAFLRTLISSRFTLRAFARVAGLPYSTLQSILNNVDGASIANITKICQGLDISIDDLATFENLTEDEQIAKLSNLNPFAKYDKNLKEFKVLTVEDKLLELYKMMNVKHVDNDKLVEICRLIKIVNFLNSDGIEGLIDLARLLAMSRLKDRLVEPFISKEQEEQLDILESKLDKLD